MNNVSRISASVFALAFGALFLTPFGAFAQNTSTTPSSPIPTTSTVSAPSATSTIASGTASSATATVSSEAITVVSATVSSHAKTSTTVKTTSTTVTTKKATATTVKSSTAKVPTKPAPKPTAPACFVFSQPLALGFDDGETHSTAKTGSYQVSQVAILQSLLAEFGYYSSKQNGKFDQTTRSAVMKFQKEAGILVDGIVGPQTRGALNESCN